MRCPRCQADNGDENRFCEACGTKLTRSCPACGHGVRPGARFCGECGAPQAGDAASPDREKRRPADRPAAGLTDLLLSSRFGMEGERKHVTVLFADIQGSTRLIEDLDPEAALKHLEPALRAMVDAVHRFDGLVNKVQGDGIMALFGAPIAKEDHALRACLAALAMQHAVAAAPAGAPRIRVGLHSGEAVVRILGDGLSMGYDASGPAVHLAARMEQIARPGAILITADVLRLAEGYVDVRGLGPTAVKGWSEPVDVYELTGSRDAPTRWSVRAARELARFVGRDEEVRGIAHALRLARSGRGQILAVLGEPGIGKSRLVHEFLGSEDAREWTVLEAGAVPYGRNTPYLPVKQLVRTWFGITDQDAPAIAADRLALGVARLSVEPAAVIPPLLSLLDLPTDDPGWQGLDPRQRRRRIIDAVTSLALATAEAAPLLLVLEDVHWIDAESQAVLDGLADSLSAAGMVLLVTYRPEYEHRWSSRTYYQAVRVDPLEAPHAGALLRDLMGDAADLLPLKRVLIERTGGTPFFLEETVRALVETGVLVGIKGALRLSRSVEQVGIPPTVQAVLAERVDRLAPEQREVLQVASVIGRDVPLRLLQAITGLAEGDLRDRLDRLRSAEFLYQTRSHPEAEFAFKHALTRDVAYGTILKELRKALHGRAVSAIEAIYPDRLDERVELLAYHAFAAEDWDRAQCHYRRAAVRALARSAYQAALSHYEHALAALERMPEDRARLRDRIEVCLDMRMALFPLGRQQDWHGRVREAEALARDIGDGRGLARAYSYLSAYFWQRGEYDEGISLGEEAVRLAEEAGDFSTTVSSRLHLAVCCRAKGDYRRHNALQRGIAEGLVGPAVYERHGMAGLPGAVSRALLAWGLADLGELGEAEAWADEAVGIAERGNNAFTRVLAYDCLGVCLLRQGRVGEAIPVVERALDLCRDAEVFLVYSLTAGLLGYAHAASGRPDVGLPLLEAATDERLFGSSFGGFPHPLLWLSEVHLLEGRIEPAKEAAERVLERSRERGDPAHEAWSLYLLARTEAERPSPRCAAAVSLYARAMRIADGIGMRPLVADCEAGSARLRERAGRPAARPAPARDRRAAKRRTAEAGQGE